MSLHGIPISEDQCIGDSLQSINDAFVYLDNSVTTLSANTMGNVKAWVSFRGDGAEGNTTVYGGYNVSRVDKISTGNYTVTFAAHVASAVYAVIGTPSATSEGVHSSIMMSRLVPKTTTGFGVVNLTVTQTLVDAPEISLVVIG